MTVAPQPGMFPARNRIISGMVGRDLESRFPDHTPEIGDTFFEVSGWTVRHPAVPDRLVHQDADE